MKGYQKFYLILNLFLVSIMFLLLSIVLPKIQEASNNKLIAYVITVVTTIGTYKLIFSGLEYLFNQWTWLKKIILGPSFIEGTWLGSFAGDGGNKYITIEKFEQTFSGINLTGIAYDQNQDVYATWKSDSIVVNEDIGYITYHYDCDLTNKNTPHKGIGEFKFDRRNKKSPPTKLIGFSADLTNGNRSANTEHKVSDELPEFSEALKKILKKTNL